MDIDKLMLEIDQLVSTVHAARYRTDETLTRQYDNKISLFYILFYSIL